MNTKLFACLTLFLLAFCIFLAFLLSRSCKEKPDLRVFAREKAIVREDSTETSVYHAKDAVLATKESKSVVMVNDLKQTAKSQKKTLSKERAKVDSNLNVSKDTTLVKAVKKEEKAADSLIATLSKTVQAQDSTKAIEDKRMALKDSAIANDSTTKVALKKNFDELAKQAKKDKRKSKWRKVGNDILIGGTFVVGGFVTYVVIAVLGVR